MSSDRKKRKVTGEEIDYINSLLEEVLCIIFDKLWKNDVKSASLVCKRWAEIIFMSPYIRRFCLVIHQPIYIIYRDSRKETRRKLEQLIRIMPKSQRCYRHLTCRVGSLEDREIRALREILLPKLASHLQSITFSSVIASYDFSLIAKVIPEISGLQELVIKGYSDLRHLKLTLRSSSIKRLSIDSDVECRLDMPQLESFTGPLSILQPSDNSPEPLPLANLKHLNVLPWFSQIQMIKELSIFRRFTHIEKLTLQPVASRDQNL